MVSRQRSVPMTARCPRWTAAASILTMTDRAAAQKRLSSGEPIRGHTKNHPVHRPSLHHQPVCGRLRRQQQYGELAGSLEGVRRIAVCRMDVDNLGHAFVSGFERAQEKTR